MPDDLTDPAVTPAPPVPPAESVTPPPEPVAPAATSTGMEPNIAAAVSVVLTFITGIIFLVIEKRSQYVRFWAMQATVFGLIMLVINLVLGFLTAAVISSLTLFSLMLQLNRIVNLGTFVIVIIMIYQAYNKKEWEMPYVGKIARDMLLKFPAS